MLYKVNEATYLKHLFLVGIREILGMLVSGWEKSKKLLISKVIVLVVPYGSFQLRVPVSSAPQSCFTSSKIFIDVSVLSASLWDFPGSFY